MSEIATIVSKLSLDSVICVYQESPQMYKSEH